MQNFKSNTLTEAFTVQEILGGGLVDPPYAGCEFSKKAGQGRFKAEFPTYCIHS